MSRFRSDSTAIDELAKPKVEPSVAMSAPLFCADEPVRTLNDPDSAAFPVDTKTLPLSALKPWLVVT